MEDDALISLFAEEGGAKDHELTGSGTDVGVVRVDVEGFLGLEAVEHLGLGVLLHKICWIIKGRGKWVYRGLNYQQCWVVKGY